MDEHEHVRALLQIAEDTKFVADAKRAEYDAALDAANESQRFALLRRNEWADAQAGARAAAERAIGALRNYFGV